MENIVESKNMFKYDAPIGRKQFIKNFLILTACYIPIFAILMLLRLFMGARTIAFVILVILAILSYIPFLYCMIINYSKRLYDITTNKEKSLLYVILYYIATFAMGFLPALIPVTMLAFFVFACLCIFMKGKMLNSDTKETEDVE